MTLLLHAHWKQNESQYIQLLWIGAGILMVVMLLYFFPSQRLLHGLQEHTSRCVWSCSPTHPWVTSINQYRGKKYFAYERDRAKDLEGCLVTTWNLIHFVSHLILGFVYPSCWFGILLVTSSFEVMECLLVDCHDVTDVIYNASGILVGVSLSSWIHHA